MNYHKLFNFAISVGELMLVSGAETYRVEDTINRILQISNLSVVDSVVMPTFILATIDDEKINSISVVKRIHIRTVHLHKVSLANNLSRQYCTNQISLDAACEQLKKIKDIPPTSPWLSILSKGLASAAFSYLIGANFFDCLITFFIGSALGAFYLLITKYTSLPLIVNMSCGAFISLLALLITQILFPSANFNSIVIGSMMPLVPGVAITNAIRDTIQGEYLSGLSRAADAVIIAAAIAVGVGFILKIYYLLGGIPL